MGPDCDSYLHASEVLNEAICAISLEINSFPFILMAFVFIEETFFLRRSCGYRVEFFLPLKVVLLFAIYEINTPLNLQLNILF